jgi:hypothetical protein
MTATRALTLGAAAAPLLRRPSFSLSSAAGWADPPPTAALRAPRTYAWRSINAIPKRTLGTPGMVGRDGPAQSAIRREQEEPNQKQAPARCQIVWLWQ